MKPRRTQQQKVLDALVRARAREVPAPELSKISLTRINELKVMGLDIVNPIEVANGIRHGYHRSVIGAVIPKGNGKAGARHPACSSQKARSSIMMSYEGSIRNCWCRTERALWVKERSH